MSNRGFENHERCRKFLFCGTFLFLAEHLPSLFLTTKFPPLIIITTKTAPQISKMLPRNRTIHVSRDTRYVDTWSNFQHITDKNFTKYFVML